jgi:protein-disulfide isomerase
MAGFRKCVENGTYSARVRQSIEEGQKLGVRATPTFFVGLTDTNSSTVKATRKIIGAQPYSAFKSAIEELLSAR